MPLLPDCHMGVKVISAKYIETVFKRGNIRHRSKRSRHTFPQQRTTVGKKRFKYSVRGSGTISLLSESLMCRH